ncbi:MAG TPA: shikimate kinase [Leptospiraceae bacterium]|jgi:shikimate kinase|nr:shikimate kinase [Leptospiraceae bacterium]HMW59209.1 shikimate kinase [Leptospiraceae bacterium]HMX58730.1 shikimate kinase [Leptospiraceae bacterium]HNJ03491.1 shikimate kinase [Leptospiraceae bacterium]HNJ36200.1 shikimate kinase [Leptospiraceae bacterium]
MQKSNIAFIGGRGAGKSRISRKFGKLSSRLSLSTDTLVCYEAGGIPITKIVEREGWQGFRDREYALLEKLTAMQNLVIDCGGGILVEAPVSPGEPEQLSARKMNLLKNCNVVYVKRDMSWLLDRVSADLNRPDLPGGYRELLERRLPWYEKAADFVLDMRGIESDDAIALLYKKYGKIE